MLIIIDYTSPFKNVHSFLQFKLVKPRLPFAMDFSWSTCFICLLAIFPGSLFVWFLPFFSPCFKHANLTQFFFQIPWDLSISRWSSHSLGPSTSGLGPNWSASPLQRTKSRITSPLSYDLSNRTSLALTWSCATWLRSPGDPLLSPTKTNHNQVI